MLKDKIEKLIPKKVNAPEEIDFSKILFFVGIIAVGIYAYKKIKEKQDAAGQ